MYVSINLRWDVVSNFPQLQAEPSGGVDVIDTASLTKIKTIPIPGGIHDMYLTPDGKYVVAGANRNEVPACKCGISVPTNLGSVIDTQTNEIAWTFSMNPAASPMADQVARIAVDARSADGMPHLGQGCGQLLHALRHPDQRPHGVAQRRGLDQAFERRHELRIVLANRATSATPRGEPAPSAAAAHRGASASRDAARKRERARPLPSAPPIEARTEAPATGGMPETAEV
jgi:hypothetical protein